MDQRLIEAGFPCHQVGAETTRERGASSALPPLYFLHVWWARRPLTPSRAAILASLLPAGSDPDLFVRQLGIERVQALIHGVPWTLTGKLLERVERRDGRELLKVDAVVLRALEEEQIFRSKNREIISSLRFANPDLTRDPALSIWESESTPLPMPWPEPGEWLPLQRVPADPAWFSMLMVIAKANNIRVPNLYGYDRAYAASVPYRASDLTVLDPTSGGGSIPFESLRLGHRVIANDLNPVATTILHATLDYPTRFGPALVTEIQQWGDRMLSTLNQELPNVFLAEGVLPPEEAALIRAHLQHCPSLFQDFNRESVTSYLFVRTVTCPHCGGEAPLLNTFWLSKEAGDPWGVRVIPQNGKVRFETYRVKQGRGPHGEDPNGATVNRGTGQCVHCQQAISGDEIKRQARAAAKHPTPMADCADGWQDRLYAVVAVRLEPKLDSHGQPLRYTSGARKGEIKTRKVVSFR